MMTNEMMPYATVPCAFTEVDNVTLFDRPAECDLFAVGTWFKLLIQT